MGLDFFRRSIELQQTYAAADFRLFARFCNLAMYASVSRTAGRCPRA
jgi:hypothetical protein